MLFSSASWNAVILQVVLQKSNINAILQNKQISLVSSLQNPSHRWSSSYRTCAHSLSRRGTGVGQVSAWQSEHSGRRSEKGLPGFATHVSLWRTWNYSPSDNVCSLAYWPPPWPYLRSPFFHFIPNCAWPTSQTPTASQSLNQSIKLTIL